MTFAISTERTVTASEFARLLDSVGWGGDDDAAAFERSYAAYPLVVHAREADGTLIGYVSAFSDGAYSTMLGELIVHRDAQGRGVGKALMRRVEDEWPGVPIYVKAMGGAKHFFQACGYRVPSAEMTVLFKRVPVSLADA
ncbi:GNAT family N-acetyltransferase [Pseudorhodoferax sp.]|uniref:GNAT family N-acetyltransferase n=1 Tax=Pseudorhodoferax sp. TaxID=1993553 RepID=UPI0039E5D8E0